MSTVEMEPKCDELWAENVCYRIPRPTLKARMWRWRDRRRLRHAMLTVKRLFKGNVPRIEDARVVELVECDGGYWLRIRMDA